MMKRAIPFLRRFGRNEDGQFVIEFALAIPVIFTIFLTSVELGMYSFRQVFLDRGLDLVVRDIRLGTGQHTSHDDLKDAICENTGTFLPDCKTTLRLEMLPTDPRNFAPAFTNTADCIDTSEEITPPRGFFHGGEHELMVLRACYKFKPFFPTTGLGFEMTKDGSGRAKMVSVSAFVQEPK